MSEVFDIDKKNIKDIASYLGSIFIEDIPNALLEIKEDERSGVKNLIKLYEKKYENHQKEIERIQCMCQYENEAYNNGFEIIAGVDEVGRGPLAGPVVACAVILPKDTVILGINDSKKLTEAKRNELYEEIQSKAIDISLGLADHSTIDAINILQATYQAMNIALQNLQVKPDVILVDAVRIPNVNIHQNPIIGGDAKSISIAAASIIAKVTRDKMMCEYHNKYPEYYFDKNKGYGSKAHTEAIKENGLCHIHRRSFTKKFI